MEAAIVRERGVAVVGVSRQNARQLRHVVLRITAIHAERVQLHDLARVILIRRRLATGVLIEIAEHRRALRRRAEHRREVAEGIRADHIAIVRDFEHADLVVQAVEVIGPELDHALIQLRLRKHRALQHRVGELVIHFAAVLRLQQRVRLLHEGHALLHQQFVRRVVDGPIIQVILEVPGVAERTGQRHLIGLEAHRDATDKSQHGIFPIRGCIGPRPRRQRHRQRLAALHTGLRIKRHRPGHRRDGRGAHREEAAPTGHRRIRYSDLRQSDLDGLTDLVVRLVVLLVGVRKRLHVDHR